MRLLAYARPARVKPRPSWATQGIFASQALTDLRPLRLLSEQGAIPLDQLARFPRRLARGRGEARSGPRRRRLRRASPLSGPATTPGFGPAAAAFALPAPVLATRCRTSGRSPTAAPSTRSGCTCAERAPEGRWVCERAVYRRRDPNDHLPDARLRDRRRAPRDRGRALAQTQPRDPPDRRRAQQSLRRGSLLLRASHLPADEAASQAEGRWPKLIVRRLPGGA